MQKWLKSLSLIVAAVFAVFALTSLVYIIKEANHDCAFGDCCEVCSQIREYEDELIILEQAHAACNLTVCEKCIQISNLEKSLSEINNSDHLCALRECEVCHLIYGCNNFLKKLFAVFLTVAFVAFCIFVCGVSLQYKQKCAWNNTLVSLKVKLTA